MPVPRAEEPEPDEETREYVGRARGRPEPAAERRRRARAAEPAAGRRRVRLVLIGVVARSCSSRRALARLGADAVTLRNRELAALLTVGLLTAIGFASVYIALKSQISTGSLGYAAFFFGLYLVAHVVARTDRAARRPLPAADGGAADGDRRDGDLPARPEQRVPAGALDRDRRRRLRRDALLAAARLPRPRALQVHLRGHGARACSSCRACP